MSCSQTDRDKLMEIATIDQLFRYLCIFLKIAFEKGFKVIGQDGLKIIILRIADSHQVNLTHFCEIVNGNLLLAPKRVRLFLDSSMPTSSYSSIVPLSTLFLYYSKV